jgi:hypothetical protein
VEKGEKVLMLMSVPVDREITDEYIEGRIQSAYLEQ